MFCNILLRFVLFCIFVFHFVYSVSLCRFVCVVLCIVSPFVLSRPCFSQVYRPLPPGGKPIAVNKYNVLSCHINMDNTVRRF